MTLGRYSAIVSFALFAALLLFTGPACRSVVRALYPVDLGDEINARIEEPMAENRTVPVFYITNRRFVSENAACSNNRFSTEIDTVVRAGRCDVAVPSFHSVGAIDEPSEGDSDLYRYFTAPVHANLTIEDAASAVSAHKSKEVLVFVHGFNVKFQEAVFRAAQIAYDAKFQGPVVVFTWPAGAKEGLIDSLMMNRTYSDNQRNAQASVEAARESIRALAKTGKRLHVMVHSMGHQVVLPALLDLSKDGITLGELILNAPDFSYDDFALAAERLKASSRRITLYCSPGDNALKASESVNGNRRIGMCGKIAGIDVINVNEVDAPVMGIGGLGHGYYSGRAIVTDLYQVLLGVKADKRLFIRKSPAKSGENYVLRR